MLRPPRSGLIGLLAAICLMVTACGSDEPGSADEPPTPETSEAQPSDGPGEGASDQPSDQPSATAKPSRKPSGTTIDITFKGDTVDPNGEERKVQAGKPFTLHIVADQPGELHIHSSPEQQLEYPAGTSDQKLTIDQPGVVEVESHDLDTLVVQLEVR